MKHEEFREKVNNLEKEYTAIDRKIRHTFNAYVQELNDRFSQFQGKYVEVEWESTLKKHKQKGFFEGFTFSNVCGIKTIEIALYKKNKNGTKSMVMVPVWLRPGYSCIYSCNYDTLTMKEV